METKKDDNLDEEEFDDEEELEDDEQPHKNKMPTDAEDLQEEYKDYKDIDVLEDIE